jgi:ABC-type antimicrobial peptide transport system permease subunit
MATPLVFQRMSNQLTIGLAVVALLLAVVNIYALAAFAVVRRTREIGIRIALGSTPLGAMRLVMTRGLVWATVGLVAGTAATVWLAAPALRQQLYETRTTDPLLLLPPVILISAIALLASWIPSRRATQIDPAITLRAE